MTEERFASVGRIVVLVAACTASVPLLLLLLAVSIGAGAALDQALYLSRMVPVLREMSSPDDLRLKALMGTDWMGSTTGLRVTRHPDGWVVVVDRFRLSPNGAATFLDLFRHRTTLCRDSAGRIYCEKEPFLPPYNPGRDSRWGCDSEKDSLATFYRNFHRTVPGNTVVDLK